MMANSTSHNNPLDINSKQFDSEAYLSDLLKKKSLDELVAVEEDMVHNIRRLDSEMQQLVCENYNKFLTATSTVKKMQNDFIEMSSEIENLSQRMKQISFLSKDLCCAFDKHRADISNLADESKTAKALQFMLELPPKLKTYLEQKEFEKAVNAFLKVRHSLFDYQHVPSFANIRTESVKIMEEIKLELKQIVKDSPFSSGELSKAVILLQQLEVPSSDIFPEFLKNCCNYLNEQLLHLAERGDKFDTEDVLEFVDDACSCFLADISLVCAINQQLFVNENNNAEVIETIDCFMMKFEETVRSRFFHEKDARECAIVVRALDRFYRRVSSCNQLVLGADYYNISISMLNNVSRHEIELVRMRVVDRVNDTIHQIRNKLAISSSKISGESLREMVTHMEQSLLIELKTALASLLLFTASDMTFSSLEPDVFSRGFGIDVHEKLVLKALKEICDIGRHFYELKSGMENVNPTLIILLAQFFISVENNSVRYILNLCQEQFRLAGDQDKIIQSKLTPLEQIRYFIRSTAHGLLKYYVYLQGVLISQLIVKSIDSRDWLRCTEPTSVRAAVKHLIENINLLDSLIRPFMDEGVRKERVVETMASRHVRRNLNYDTCSISSTLDKLWSDRVDFSANIEFNRTSVSTALINIVLKSFLEAVRLQTFSKFGVQQIQVDCYYLQQNLWRYTSDEHLTISLLDEILSSALHRATDPILMEVAIVRRICSSQ